MFVVDTNILVYAANRDSSFHERASALLDEWRGRPGAWFLTWGIAYEFLRVVTHAKVLERPWTSQEAWSHVDGLLASPGLIMLTESSRHAEMLKVVIAGLPSLGGNLVHDAHTAVLMREHGVRRIYTRDMDFHRFRSIEVVDPLA